MTSLLPTSLQNSLQGIVQQSNLRGASIRAILLSTTEGVPLGRVMQQQQQQNLNEDVLSSIESVWAPASKQFPVLGLDKVKQVTAIYDHGSLIHIYQAPMVRVTS
jgi:ragulator complex protein LAMTOR3